VSVNKNQLFCKPKGWLVRWGLQMSCFARWLVILLCLFFCSVLFFTLSDNFGAWRSGGFSFADFQFGALHCHYTTKVDAGQNPDSYRDQITT
jgi:hypothetical protein